MIGCVGQVHAESIPALGTGMQLDTREEWRAGGPEVEKPRIDVTDGYGISDGYPLALGEFGSAWHGSEDI